MGERPYLLDQKNFLCSTICLSENSLPIPLRGNRSDLHHCHSESNERCINLKETPHESAIYDVAKTKSATSFATNVRGMCCHFKTLQIFMISVRRAGKRPLTLLHLDSNAIITPILHWLASIISTTLTIFTTL